MMTLQKIAYYQIFSFDAFGSINYFNKCSIFEIEMAKGTLKFQMLKVKYLL